MCVCVEERGGGYLGAPREADRQAGGGGGRLTGRPACRRNESYTRPNGTQFSIL